MNDLPLLLRLLAWMIPVLTSLGKKHAHNRGIHWEIPPFEFPRSSPAPARRAQQSTVRPKAASRRKN